MLMIPCPWCGERAETEFAYGENATAERPTEPEAVSDEQWIDYVYMRDNPRGPHVELWYHGAGCRRWFKVCRDTVTNRILSSCPPGEVPS
jgi:heterotetrameric sarcosine oxidase delta subunit